MTGPVVITGGGTGGHVFPMEAVAEALRAKGLAAAELRYVGSQRGQEASLLAGGDVALTLLPGRGLRRSWRPDALFSNVGAALGLAVALFAALVLVRRWRPSVVVSVGGYASFAVSAAAVCWRRPVVLVELDAAPGAAQRLLGRYATTRCCAFPAAGANVVVTGAPLRAAIAEVDRSRDARDAAKAAYRPPIDATRAVVVVMTGSLGSARVNAAVASLARAWRARTDRAIVHVTGRRDYDAFAAASSHEGLDYRVVAFADMSELWGLCDAAICRAGAITVAELTALSIPSILVPLPGAPGDHQTRNAQAVAAAGGARVLPDDRCTGEALAALLDEMLVPATLAAMAEGAGTLARRDGATSIADAIVAAQRRS